MQLTEAMLLPSSDSSTPSPKSAVIATVQPPLPHVLGSGIGARSTEVDGGIGGVGTSTNAPPRNAALVTEAGAASPPALLTVTATTRWLFAIWHCTVDLRSA